MLRYLVNVSVLLMVVFVFAQAAETDLPDINQTRVTIPWEEFKVILEKAYAKPPDTAQVYPPPINYAIYNAEFSGALREEHVEMTARISVETFGKEWVTVPLFPSQISINSTQVDGKSVSLPVINSYYSFLSSKAGRYNIVVVLGLNLTDSGSSNHFTLPIPYCSGAKMSLTVPGQDRDIKITPSVPLSQNRVANGTQIVAILPYTNSVSVEWHREIKTVATEDEKPWLIAEVGSIVSVGEGLMDITSQINYSIMQGKVELLVCKLPETVNIKDVAYSELLNWDIERKDGAQIIKVFPRSKINGNHSIIINYEKVLPEISGTFDVPVIEVLDVERQKGFYGIVAVTNIELKTEMEKLVKASRIDRSELPDMVWSGTSLPILHAFKYVELPYSIYLTIEKHADVPVKVATIDDVSYTGVYTQEGHGITQATFRVRNNLKQFIAITLPEGSELWSCFVSGNPVKPGQNKDNQILIPLEKSPPGSMESASFPLEVIYYTKHSKIGGFKQVKYLLPIVDIPISRLSWSVYLPIKYNYNLVDANVQEAQGYYGYDGRGAGLTSTTSAPAPAMEQQAEYDYMAKDEEYTREKKMAIPSQIQQNLQSYMQERIGAASNVGVLPVAIDIPHEGRLYNFSQILIAEDKEMKPLFVKFMCIASGGFAFVKMVTFIVLVIGILLSLLWVFAYLEKKNPNRQRLLIYIGAIIVMLFLAHWFGVTRSFINWTLVFALFLCIIYAIVYWIRRRLQKPQPV